MEPVQIGRGDAIEQRAAAVGHLAAMEPVQIGRGDATRGPPSWPPSPPQWSPSRSDGVTAPSPRGNTHRIVPQWSPSRSDGVTAGGKHAAKSKHTAPQWSPSRSDGGTGL